MAERASRPTLAKVALLAHVSRSTASNALSGNGRVSPETARRVQATADALGYRIDTTARNLSLGRVTTVGVLIPHSVVEMNRDHESLLWLRLSDGFVSRCSELGSAVTFMVDHQGQVLVDSGVDVLVLLGNHSPDVVAELSLPFGLPVVSGQEFPGVVSNVTRHDAQAISECVVHHLAQIGRRHLCWMPGPTFEQVRSWESTLRQACESAQMRFCVVEQDGSQASLERALAEARNEGADAVFGAFTRPEHVLNALHRIGLSTPTDIAIIAQSEGLVERAIRPSITTLSLCGFESGRMLADHAVAVARSACAETEAMPFSLVVRDSTTHSGCAD